MRNELELGSSGRRISGNSSRYMYCRLRSTRPSTAPRGRGTGGQRADSHWPRDSAEGFFGLRRGWGDRETAKMGSVSVLVGRAAHPTRKQPCAAQRARVTPPTPCICTGFTQASSNARDYSDLDSSQFSHSEISDKVNAKFQLNSHYQSVNLNRSVL